MIDQLVLLLLTAIITFALYPIWINFVYKYQMGEKIREDGPQTHLKKAGTPSMGGVVFLLTVSLVTLLFNRSRTQTLFPIFVISMAGLFGIIEDFTKVYKWSGLPSTLRVEDRGKKVFGRIPGISTLWDWFIELSRVVGSSDEKGIQTYKKFILQGVIAGFVAYWTFFKLGWDYFWFPLVGNVHVGILYPIVIFFLFLAVLNFVAFTDGVDGLAGGLGAIAMGAFWVVAIALAYNSLGTLAATFVGALLPFLYFNIHPARIFMGDVGSHVLGAALVIFAIVMHREIAAIFILGVFLVDGMSSPIQQFSVKLTGKRVFRMAPLHHHFEMKGWPETKVTERFWLVGILLAFIGIFVALM